MVNHAFRHDGPIAQPSFQEYRSLRTAHASLRDELIAAERESFSQFQLAEVWTKLATGDLQIVDEFHDEERYYLVLRETKRAPLDPMRPGVFEVFRRILMAGCEKVVSVDMEMSPSTVAYRAKRAITLMGLSCRVFDVPLLIAAAAQAFTQRSAASMRCIQLGHGPTRRLCVSLARPETRLAGRLSPASLQVLKAFVAGKSRSIIAFERGTSKRTIANQLATVFGALRVSGRLDVLRELAHDAVALAEGPSAVAECVEIELEPSAPAPDLHASLAHLARGRADVSVMLMEQCR